MNNHQHIIKNQIVSINISVETDYYQLKDKISYILQRLVYPKLGVICDKHSKNNVQHTLNKLEIDLGIVNISDINSVLINQIPQQFEVALINLLKNSQEYASYYNNFQNHHQTEMQKFNNQLLQVIQHFLSTGTLPWWYKENKKSFTSILIELATKDLKNTKALLCSLNKKGWQRLIIQLSDNQLLLLFKIIHPELNQKIHKLYLSFNKLIYFTNPTFTITHNKLRLYYWSYVLTLATSESNKSNLTSIFKELTLYVATFLKDSHDKSLNEQVVIHLMTLLRQVFINSSTSGKREKSLLTALSEFIKFLQKTAKNDNLDKLKAYHQELITLEKQTLSQSFAQIIPLANIDQSIYPLDDAYYIDNSGIILYWVFLKNLGTKLDLLTKNQDEFFNKKSRIRMVLLLNLFVDYNFNNINEHELILNKILCGLPITALVPNKINVKSIERQEFKSLTSSLITHWKAIGKITIENFAQTFVKRKGIIKQQNEQWILRVEKNPYDVLLNKLPWSINFIKLPWIKNPIIVEW